MGVFHWQHLGLPLGFGVPPGLPCLEGLPDLLNGQRLDWNGLRPLEVTLAFEGAVRRQEPSEKATVDRSQAYKDSTQPDRKQERSLSVLLVGAVLFIIALSAALSFTGHFTSDVAFVMGTALGAFAAILKDFLLPVVT